MTSPDILDIVPEHVVDPVRRASWPKRIGTAFGDGLLAALLNAAVVVWLAGIGWPQKPTEAPNAISVDLVNHMPGAQGGGADAAAGASASGARGAGGARNKAEPVKPPAPEHVAASPPQPQPPAEAEPQPAPAAPPPAPHAAATPPPPSAEPAAAQAPPTASAPAAVPPPPEHPDGSAQPHLVQAPAAPHVAETQADEPRRPVIAPSDVPEATPKAGPPPAQPKVASSEHADDAVATATPPPPKPPTPTAEQKRQADNTAALAAMLPFGSNITADPFRAQVSGHGEALDEAYRGAVYGNFNKAQDVVEAAQANHLKGQAVVAFTVDDKGGLAQLAIAVSSGNPAVDQAALELIRRAAPFPPPPPGAQRSFSPAIGLGLDQ